MHKIDIFDSIQSPPTDGGDSLDWFQIITLLHAFIPEIWKQDSVWLGLVAFR